MAMPFAECCCDWWRRHRKRLHRYCSPTGRQECGQLRVVAQASSEQSYCESQHTYTHTHVLTFVALGSSEQSSCELLFALRLICSKNLNKTTTRENAYFDTQGYVATSVLLERRYHTISSTLHRLFVIHGFDENMKLHNHKF
jgi:hypothetical protein